MRVKGHQRVFGGREELVIGKGLGSPSAILGSSDHMMSG